MAYSYLFGIALFGAMIVWIIILLSHIGFRRAHRGQPLPIRMWGFPYMQAAGLTLIVALLITMGLDADWRLSWLVGLPWLMGLSLAYLVRARFKPAA
jgi:L-asparagine transporter-like permease